MKYHLINNLFAPKTKPADAGFKEFRAGFRSVLKDLDSEGTIRLQDNGSVKIGVEKDAVAEVMRAEMAKLAGVTMAPVTSPLSAFIDGAVKAGKAKLA